jgi:transposase
MNRLVAAYPGRQIHVVLVNLSTHKPKRERWLKRHPNVHFHFTPTYASWLNQVEIWFSKLVRDSLAGASFISPRQLRELIDAYIARHNQNPKPFVWTAARVHKTLLKPRFRDL